MRSLPYKEEINKALLKKERKSLNETIINVDSSAHESC